MNSSCQGLFHDATEESRHVVEFVKMRNEDSDIFFVRANKED